MKKYLSVLLIIETVIILSGCPGTKLDSSSKPLDSLEYGTKNTILVPVSDAQSWSEFAYMAAISAGNKINQSPHNASVIALDCFGIMNEYVKDNYLNRYSPDYIYMLGEEDEWSQGHWELTEAGSATIHDNSKYGRSGTINGATWSGSDLTFDGIDDYVEISGYKGITGSNSRTVAAWVKMNSGDGGEILSWGGNGSGKRWIMKIDDNGYLCVDIGNAYITGKTNLRDSLWHHVAATMSKSNSSIAGIKLYIDGIREEISKVYDASASSLSIGLKGYWRFEESSGLHTVDSSPWGNDGSLNTNDAQGYAYTPEFVSGKIGNCVKLKRADQDWVEIGNRPFFNEIFTDEFSVSFWVETGHNKDTSGNEVFASVGHVYSQGWELRRWDESDELIFIWNYAFRKGDNVSTGTPVPANQWVHVAATYDLPNKTAKIYLNGELKNSKNVTSVVLPEAQELRFGCGGYQGGIECFIDGCIDECAVWDKALTSSEITSLYNKGEGMIIDIASTPINTESSANLKIGVYKGTDNYFRGVIKEVRVYDSILPEKEIKNMSLHRLQDNAGITRIRVSSLDDVCCELARFWGTSNQIVVCGDDDYANGLAASALAGRLEAPLFFFDASAGFSKQIQSCIRSLGTGSALLVGSNSIVTSQLSGIGVSSTSLNDAKEVLAWMGNNGLPVDYIATCNAKDRTFGYAPKSSLCAPLLATARNGAVAPLSFDADILHSFWYDNITNKQPSGAADSKDGKWHTGSFTLNNGTYNFAISNTSSFQRVNIDLNHNGNYGDAGEFFKNSDIITLNGRRYSIVSEVKEYFTPGNLKFTYPCYQEINENLNDYYTIIGHHPKYLAVVGLIDAFPSGIATARPQVFGDYSYNITDMMFSNIDSDPFFEIAVGRILGENVCITTLFGTRSITYNDLIGDPDNWADNMCELGAFNERLFSVSRNFENCAFDVDWWSHPSAIALPEDKRDLTRYGNFAQDDHGGNGGFSEINTKTSNLLAPCVVNAGGCHVGGIDEVGGEFTNSVLVAMVRQGIICFDAWQRGTPASKDIGRDNFWNAILYNGATLGQARLYELHTMIANNNNYYEIYGEILIGDPALRIYTPSSEPKYAPAHVVADGNTLTVYAPEDYWTDPIPAGSIWSHPKDEYVYTGPGLTGSEYDPGKRFVATYTANSQINTMTQEPDVPRPLGWTGKYLIDKHQDGTKTFYWIIRFDEFDASNGKFVQKRNMIKYNLK